MYTSHFTMALKADGTCWGWGGNSYGQLGNNTRTSYSSPISVVGDHSFIQLATTGGPTSGGCLGLKADGTCWGWGGNSYVNLGNNTMTSYSSPISVVGNHSFIQITANSGASYGLKADGLCWSWGGNEYGEIGNNTLTYYSSPVVVVGNHSFIQISAGYLFCFGLKADGSCWGWGYNGNNNLGNNTTGNSYSSPISVVGNISFSKLVQLQNTAYCAGALQNNGNFWVWGRNNYGGLCNNTTTDYASPILIYNIYS